MECGTLWLINYWNGGVCMLIGEYQHTIDAKGRMIVPAKFREDLGFTFIVTRGLDGCLYGYPLEQWELIQEKLRNLPQSKKDARAFTRFMNSAAIEVEFDKQGRINISQTLREYAGLEKIWNDARWQEYIADTEDNFEELAEHMIDFGF